MQKSKKGFTLVELIVVLAILAVIAAIAIPTAYSAVERARQAADRATVDNVNGAIRAYAAVIMMDPRYAEADTHDAIIAGATVQKALVDGALDPDIKFQSDKSAVTWQDSEGNGPGKFEYSNTNAGSAQSIPKNINIFSGSDEV